MTLRRASSSTTARGSELLKKGKSIQSVETGVRILEVLAHAPASLQLREVAGDSGMSRSQTHRYLLAYVRTGLARQDPATGRYELGPLALRIGLAALRRAKPVVAATDALIELVDSTGFTGMVIIWGEHGPIIVRLRQGRRVVIMAAQVGSTTPILGSSAGHVLLAYLPEEVAAEAAATVWHARHPAADEGWKAVLQALRKEVRRTGVATVSGTTIPGLAAVSGPVLDASGQIQAVLTLVAHAEDMLTENKPALAALRAACSRASERVAAGETKT